MLVNAGSSFTMPAPELLPTASHTSRCLDLGLGCVAFIADRLQVGVVVRATFCLWHDVIYRVAQRNLVLSGAWLAESVVALHHSTSEFVPLCAISTLVTIASQFFIEAVCGWMFLAASPSPFYKSAASWMRAGFWCCLHCNLPRTL
jgi:hypothetical protein